MSKLSTIQSLPLRRLLTTAMALTMAAFVVANREVITSMVDAVRRADPLALSGGILLSLAAMTNRGFLNRAAHRAVGLDAPLPAMVRTAAVGFAANKIVRTGGVSGLAVFVRHGRRHGFACGAVAASCVLAAVASFAALGTLLAAAIVLLAISGGLTGWWLTAAAGFGGFAAIVVAGAVAMSRRRTLVANLWRRLGSLGSRIIARPGLVGDGGIDELFDALARARSDLRSSRRVLAHAVAAKVLGAAMLLAAASAAGIEVSVAGAVIIYATALAASLVAIVPSGVGIVEASAAAMLVGTDTPMAVAAVAVGLFRLFDLWLPLLVGIWIGRRELRRHDGEQSAEARSATALVCTSTPAVTAWAVAPEPVVSGAAFGPLSRAAWR